MPEKNLPQVVEIDFDDDVIESVLVDGKVFIPVRRICENIGLEWSTQRRKLELDPKFNCVHMTTVARDGKTREMTCLSERDCHAWLFGINSNKILPDYREKLLAYQQRCMDVITAYWRGEAIDVHNTKAEPLSINQITDTFKAARLLATEIGLAGKPAILAANCGTRNLHQVDVLALLEINLNDLPDENNVTPFFPDETGNTNPQKSLFPEDDHLVIYQFENQKIRALKEESKGPWWVLTDIGKALDYNGIRVIVHRAFSTHTKKEPILTRKNLRIPMIVIDTPGLMKLLRRSVKPKSDSFLDWMVQTIDTTPKNKSTAAKLVPFRR